MPRQYCLRLLGRLYVQYHSIIQTTTRPYTKITKDAYQITKQMANNANGNQMASHSQSFLKKSYHTNLPSFYQIHSNLIYKYMKLMGKRNIGYEIWKEHVKRTWKEAFYGGVLRSAWCYDLGTFIQRLNNQALASYCHWIGPFWNSLRGVRWPAERWLIVSSVLRNSLCWTPSFTGSIALSSKWLCVAMITSMNSVGAHIPMMLALAVVQSINNVINAEGPSRETYYPWKDIQMKNDIKKLYHNKNFIFFNQIIRLCWISLCLTPLIITSPLCVWMGLGWELWIKMLRRTLELCGPAFIKWGQWAATRRDMLPVELCKELQKLQTEAPAHKYEISKNEIEKSFGISTDMIFSKFEEKPMASGSIGQIHKAILSDIGSSMTGIPEGTEVAVKVRHPGIDYTFQRDLDLMLMVSNYIKQFTSFRSFDLEETIKQFAAPMSEQVDLCVEAANLTCFGNNFLDDDYVTFPEPLYPLVSPSVLVETFKHGESISNLIETSSSVEQIKRYGNSLAILGSETFFKMVVHHNLLHGDLHPGNILVEFVPDVPKSIKSISKLFKNINFEKLYLEKIKSNNHIKPKIVLLDAGMATHLSLNERERMYKLFKAVAERDGYATAKYALSFSGNKQTCENEALFYKDMIEHYEEISDENWDTCKFQTSSEAFGEVVDIIRRHKVSLPGQICSCLFSVFVMEGWSSKLDPNHSLMYQIEDLVKETENTWKFEFQRLIKHFN